MVGLLGYLAAGAAEGAGTGIVAKAKALREERLAELERGFTLQRDRDQREFAAAENEKNRQFQRESQQGDLIDLGGGKYGVRKGARVEPLTDAEGNAVSVNVPSGYRQLTPDEIKAAGLDPSKGYQVATSGADKGKISQIGGGGTTVNVGGDAYSPGWKKIDEAFADEYIRWNTAGRGDAAKQMDQLNEALAILEEGKGTGAIGALPDFMQPFLNKEGTIAREAVEEVVQRNLREILGAQFTEKEGARLISRAYNPTLPPEENAKRVRRLIEQIGTMAQAKQAMVEYFDQNGTLKGYTGERPSMATLDGLFTESGDLPEGVTEADIQFTMKKHGLTRDQVLERLNANGSRSSGASGSF